MSNENRAAFTLSDIKAIRYLVIAVGVLGAFMFTVTDPDEPVIVVGFLVTITAVPIGAIYGLRRWAKKKHEHDGSS